MTPEIRCYPSIKEFSQEAAAFICEQICAGVKRRGLFTLVLSGGRTPKSIYELLAKPSYSREIPWDCVHLFWADERCVSFYHPESNFRLASDAFISGVPLPAANVHRIRVEGMSPQEAAKDCEATLRDFFRIRRGWPSFDLILLGMGEDGHTASLFPDDPALQESKAWVVPVEERGRPPVPRVTLTLSVINNARCVAFMVRGEKKCDVIDNILRDPEDAAKRYPAAMVRPKGRLLWFMQNVGDVSTYYNRAKSFGI